QAIVHPALRAHALGRVHASAVAGRRIRVVPGPQARILPPAGDRAGGARLLHAHLQLLVVLPHVHGCRLPVADDGRAGAGPGLGRHRAGRRQPRLRIPVAPLEHARSRGCRLRHCRDAAWKRVVVHRATLCARAHSGARAMTIGFKARLARPAQPKNATWAFLVLPKAASAKLPTRAMLTVEGTFGGAPFKATLEPDGQGGHWLKVPKKLREAAGVEVGAVVELDIAPSTTQHEPKAPADLRAALKAHPAAKATWDATTTTARRDWIAWMTSGKQAATRNKRRAAMMDMLEHGKKRVCCFDRSGQYGGNFSSPEAAD